MAGMRTPCYYAGAGTASYRVGEPLGSRWEGSTGRRIRDERDQCHPRARRGTGRRVDRHSLVVASATGPLATNPTAALASSTSMTIRSLVTTGRAGSIVVAGGSAV